MKLTKQQLKEFILTEVKKIAIKEGWEKIFPVESCPKPLSEGKITESSSAPNPEPKTEEIQIEEVKLLAEEFKRMKELVDFRNPLLNVPNVKNCDCTGPCNTNTCIGKRASSYL